MPSSEIQLLERKMNIENQIQDSLNQMQENMKTESLLNHKSMLNLLPIIETVNIPNASNICENTKQIIEEFLIILNLEEKRRKIFTSLNNITKKGVVRKNMKEERKQKYKDNISPYSLRRECSVKEKDE